MINIIYFLMMILVGASSIAQAGEVQVVAKMPWSTNDTDYVVDVTTIINGSNGLPIKKIKFVDSEKKKVSASFDSVDGFVSGFALQDNGACLITLWTTGSAYRIWVFQDIGSQIKSVLDVGSKYPPKILSNDACPDIQMGDNKYLWTKDGYKLKP